ncbi:MAG: hypothetical protein E7266_04330 [Lachnospiraceae bacterium]|nr:hypothetical protein [Lachnospiraceae bacterium]
MKEIICESCGGLYNKKAAICPYCGRENESVALKEQQDYIDSYNRKIKSVYRTEPKNAKQKVQKANKAIYIAAVALIAAFMLIIGASGLIVATINLSEKFALQNQEKNLVKLENYYEKGDYEAIGKLLNKIEDSYGVTYEKYTTAYDWYDRLKFHTDIMKDNVEYEKYRSAEDFAEYFSWFFAELSDIEAHREKGFVYGEEEAAIYVKEQYYTNLKQYMLLTDEEIEQATMMYDSEADYKELAEKVKERFAVNMPEE